MARALRLCALLWAFMLLQPPFEFSTRGAAAETNCCAPINVRKCQPRGQPCMQSKPAVGNIRARRMQWFQYHDSLEISSPRAKILRSASTLYPHTFLRLLCNRDFYTAHPTVVTYKCVILCSAKSMVWIVTSIEFCRNTWALRWCGVNL